MTPTCYDCLPPLAAKYAMAERVKFQEMAGMEVSMAWGYAAIPIGAVFAMLGSIAHFLDRRSAELESAV